MVKSKSNMFGGLGLGLEMERGYGGGQGGCPWSVMEGVSLCSVQID